MSRHPWQLPTLSLFFLLATALVGAGKPTKEKKEPPPNYYPLEVGNEWRFNLTVGEKTTNMVSRIAKIENIDGVALARLEGEVNNQVGATEHLRQTEKGIFRHRYNGAECDPPVCLLKYPVKVGAKWEDKLTVGKEKAKYSCETKEETVEVGAGKHKCVRVDLRLDSMGQIVNTSYWFVKDVGMVKQTVDVGDLSILLELQSFQLKKGNK
jgi:hypothetical protein